MHATRTARPADPLLRPGRRAFLRGGAAAVGAASVGLGFSPCARAGGASTTLVYVFLRGGMDGLSVVVPTSGNSLTHYANARSGSGRSTFIDPMGATPPLPLDASFGLHPACAALHQLYLQHRLAVIHACGHADPATYTRSHFDAQEQIELGTPGEQSSASGWLGRYLQTAVPAPSPVFTALASSSNPPLSLAGWPDVATLDSPDSFRPNSPWSPYSDTPLRALAEMYMGEGSLDAAALSALNAVDVVGQLDLGNYLPAGGVVYPDTAIGQDARLVAQLVRSDLGIQVATLDVGGWDTHNDQNVLQSYGFGGLLGNLSDALAALYRDLAADGRGNDVAIVVQSEFGRQVTENANRGTDHGLGCPMFVLGGGVDNRGGGSAARVFGSFPGLAPLERVDDSVRPTTDFRLVLASVADRLLGHPSAGTLFPGYSYAPPAAWFA